MPEKMQNEPIEPVKKVKESESVTLTKAELEALMRDTAINAAALAKEDVRRELQETALGRPNPDTSKKLKEPILFISNKIGLKRVIKPKQQHRDKITGEMVVIEGRYIQFREGRFYAQTEEQLSVLREWVKENNGIFEVTEEDKEYLKMNAKQQVDGQKFKTLKNVTSARVGKQGSVG